MNDPLFDFHLSSRACDKCKVTFSGSDIDSKVKKFESDIDEITSGNAEELEKLLRRMRYFLHENHYWILDVKRKLIDIYGNKPGFELYKIPKVRMSANIGKLGSCL